MNPIIRRALQGRTTGPAGRARSRALWTAVATVATALAVATPATAEEFGLQGGGFSARFHAPQNLGYLDARAETLPVPAERTQAGGHPDLTVELGFNTEPIENDPAGEVSRPVEQVRDIVADLPAGFYGNPQNRPSCTVREFRNGFGSCDVNAQVGTVILQVGSLPSSGDVYKSASPIYNLTTRDDETAVLGFSTLNQPTVMKVTPRTDGDYGLTAKISGVTQSGGRIFGARMTLWGNPSDPVHDRLRYGPFGDPNPVYDENFNIIGNYGYPSTAPALPFLSAPARCDGPLTARIRTRSWMNPERWVEYAEEMAPQTGCDQLRFDPSVDVKPTSSAAGQPTGADIDLKVPQTNSLDELATPTVKDVTVKLPEGMAISPGAADGLAACSDEQLATDSREPETCPDASKIGTVAISTPLLAQKLEGSVYLGSQKSQDPTSGEMYRMFLTGYGKGVRIKLKGNIVADPKTGQLTATFRQNPQLPFDSLSLDLEDGPRAVLTNPTTCGTKTTGSTVTSYAGNAVNSDSSFAIDQGCPQGGFSPGFTAGTLDPFAGGLSPFTMTTVRNDGDQDLTNIKLDLPSGLLGALGKVPVCAEAQAAAGACDASTRLGSTTVSVGTGPSPYALPGTVSLAGPYKGAPYSLSIAVPAKAGPLDLGLVVVRSPLVIDANNAKVSAPVDDLPQIVGGVPLHYRTISVTLDRPGFMFNATNCTASQVGATITSASGAVARPSARYQPQGCDKLRLAPSLKISYSGKSDLKKGRNPKLTADLGQTFGQAGLKRVKVTLPTISSLRPENAEALCTPEQAAARACPEASIVGRASATTPALHESLTGPVYFLKGTRKTASGKVVATLPKLWLKLRGDGVDLDLRADTAVSGKRLVTTFNDIPDAPISNFKLEIDGGKNGILTAVEDPCTASRRTTVSFDGQNGARQTRALNISAPECGVRAAVAASASKATVRFTGIAAGKVSVSGSGLSSKSRTVKSGESATVVANLTAATRRQIASGRSVKLRVKATFDPKAQGKTVSVTKTVTVKGAKGR